MIKYLTVTLLCILFFDFCVNYIDLQGFSILKISYTLAGWLVVILSTTYLVKRLNYIIDKFGHVAYSIFMLIVSWNAILILRSIAGDSSEIATILGNEDTALALLIPLVIVFAASKKNIRIFYSLLYGYTWLFIPVIVSLILIGDVGFQKLAFLFAPVFFLITILTYNRVSSVVIVIIASVLIGYISIMYTGTRSDLLRLLLLYLVLFGGAFFGFYKDSINLKVYILLLLPIIILFAAVNIGESPFQMVKENYAQGELTTDTRTFLYKELYADLNSTGDLLIGRGASGRYYSPYFASILAGDHYNRLTVEVGWLWLLLRGGFVSFILYASILIYAIVKCFYYSIN